MDEMRSAKLALDFLVCLMKAWLSNCPLVGLSDGSNAQHNSTNCTNVDEQSSTVDLISSSIPPSTKAPFELRMCNRDKL